MARLAVVLATLFALAGCERVNGPDYTPQIRADSLRQAISDSLYDAEMARREQRAYEVRTRSARYRRVDAHRTALWGMVTSDDWTAAHDTVILDGLFRIVDNVNTPRAVAPTTAGIPDAVWAGPPIPLAQFRDGMPRVLDAFGQAIDSVAARYGVDERVRAVSKTDTLRRERTMAGYTIYTVTTRTQIESASGTVLRVSEYELDYPREVHAVLAERDGLARPLRVVGGRGGIWTEVVQTPDGRALSMRYNAHGARYWSESYAEYRGGRWRYLGHDGDLSLAPVPPFADVYRDREVDLGAMEVRASVIGPGNGGLSGCLAAPIRRRGGRLTTGPAVWHRGAASCQEYAFQPSVEVTQDTSRYPVAAGRFALDVSVRARRDTTSRYEWRLLNPVGRTQWAESIPAGFPADSTYHFGTDTALPGTWMLVQTRRRVLPHVGVVREPPQVTVRRR